MSTRRVRHRARTVLIPVAVLTAFVAGAEAPLDPERGREP